jgi:hypothetical protein
VDGPCRTGNGRTHGCRGHSGGGPAPHEHSTRQRYLPDATFAPDAENIVIDPYVFKPGEIGRTGAPNTPRTIVPCGAPPVRHEPSPTVATGVAVVTIQPRMGANSPTRPDPLTRVPVSGLRSRPFHRHVPRRARRPTVIGTNTTSYRCGPVSRATSANEARGESPRVRYERSAERGRCMVDPTRRPRDGAGTTGSVHYTNVPLQFSTATIAAPPGVREAVGESSSDDPAGVVS